MTENRLRGINTAASGSVDRGVCVSVAACMFVSVDDGEMTRFEEEGLCSQSIIFRDDKGCFVPCQRCKTNTSRPYKYCG